jgi:hypothetical protein
MEGKIKFFQARVLGAVALVMGSSSSFAATFSDTNWISMGGIPGASGYVYAAVVDDTGNLYITGQFTIVGDVFATNIAKWNGSSWSALGSGISGPAAYPYYGGPVYALAVSGGILYAGGSFTNAGGIAATNIAKWDGTNWSALGSGTDGRISALAVSGSALYAGGNFTTAGSIAATNIAKWDGNSWSALGSGMDGGISALAVSGSELYAGGNFTTAGGNAATNIAQWDGNSWSALDSGVDGGISALAVSGYDVYAGGRFATAGGIAATNIAKWRNGSGWSALGPGMNPQVIALAVYGGALYVVNDPYGGMYPPGYVYKWDGNSWSVLGQMNGNFSGGYVLPVYALAVSGSDLYAGGFFTVVNSTSASSIAKWNGGSWSALEPGLNGIFPQTYPNVTALAVSGNDAYVGGFFATAGGAGAAYNIARWNGSGWSALGSGIGPNFYFDSVNALTASGSDLYVGGNFTETGGSAAKYVAKWDGSSWSALGSGLGSDTVSAQVHALAVSGNDLYAAGAFMTASGIAVTNIAKWDGSSWSALGSGIGDANSSVNVLAVSRSDVYAGGSFTTAGGIAATNIARWDGGSWSALGSGISAPAAYPYNGGSVVALAVSGSDLYAGGSFTSTGGVAATNIAKWDGNSWSPLGSGLNGGVAALVVSGGNLYAGGSFTMAGGGAGNYIAKWDGTNWSALGSGLRAGSSVFALAISGSELYAVGDFTTAGGKVSAYVARAIVNPPILVIEPDGLGAYFLRFSGVPGSAYRLQRASGLSGPWAASSTQIAPASGHLEFWDVFPPPGQAFYRSVGP